VTEFRGFPQYLHENSGIIITRGLNSFIPHPFQFIIRQSFRNPILYNLENNSVVEQCTENMYVYKYFRHRFLSLLLNDAVSIESIKRR
jgi:hypothetical protein